MKKSQPIGLAHNALAFETTLTGTLTSPKDIRIDGHIEGDVTCGGKVVVGESGSIHGNIVAENAEIMGKVKGSIKVSDLLVLKSSSVFEGDITTRVLSVEPNATLCGTCTMQLVDAKAAEPKMK